MNQTRTTKSNSAPALNCLGVFAKYWQPGKVKTRLASRIGDQSASDVYHCLLKLLIGKLVSSGDRRVIAFDPPQTKSEFVELAGVHWELVPQVGEASVFEIPLPVTADLGERMSNFFREQFARASVLDASLQSLGSRVILIGSDTPTIEPGEIQLAFELLESDDVVVGPAEDGGYWLIGMNHFVPEVFQDVDWSTNSVFDQTIQNLEKHSTSYSLLARKNDIDDWNDLLRLGDELQVAGDDSQMSNELVSRITKLAREFELT